MFEIDWDKLLIPSGSIAELVVRGTIVYLVIFTTMRLLPRRELGGMAASDVLVLVIIADAVQDALTGGYESITEGLILVGTIFMWATLIDWLDSLFPRLRLAEAGPLPIISNGRLLRRNMRRENITEDELNAQLRQHGHESASEIRLGHVEGDGQISFLPFRKGGGDDRSKAAEKRKRHH
jgi:uncharacterized membrane protein YcaP (DUF421 family)